MTEFSPQARGHIHLRRLAGDHTQVVNRMAGAFLAAAHFGSGNRDRTPAQSAYTTSFASLRPTASGSSPTRVLAGKAPRAPGGSIAATLWSQPIARLAAGDLSSVATEELASESEASSSRLGVYTVGSKDVWVLQTEDDPPPR